MARTAKTTTRSTKAPVAKRKPGRPPGSKTLSKAAAKPAPKTGRRTATPKPVATAVPKLSKEELRDQVEKLERSVATLRARSRDATRAAKTSAARIAELEAQVAQFETAAAAKPAPAEQAPKPARATRPRRRSRDIDPGDAVPPGVAVVEPAPLDEEAETALENLEAHLGDG